MKKILLVFIFTITCFSLAAQRPRWISKTPIPTNDSYLYNVEFGIGNTPNEAENNAYAKQFRFAAMTMKVSVDINEIINSLQKGTDYRVISQYYTIPISKVCEYVEKNNKGYCVFILCQVAKSSITHQFDNSFNDCTDHSDDWRALGLSVFPGLGQIIVKKNKPVGYAFMIGDLALIGGGIYCLIESNNQYDISQNPNYTNNYRQDAYDNYKMLDTSSKILFGAAAAVYVINLYTAYKMPTKTKGFAFAPKLIPENNNLAYGIGISYNF